MSRWHTWYVYHVICWYVRALGVCACVRVYLYVCALFFFASSFFEVFLFSLHFSFPLNFESVRPQMVPYMCTVHGEFGMFGIAAAAAVRKHNEKAPHFRHIKSCTTKTMNGSISEQKL